MISVPRRTKFILILGFVTFALLLSYYHTSTPPERRYRWKPSGQDEDINLEDTPTNPEVPATTALCEGEDCFRGSWKRRQQPFKSLEEVKPWTGCPSPPPATGERTEEEQARADAKRLLDVMNWEWRPSKGVLKEWNAEEFVIRLLKSPGGLIIVGDEMSDQYFSSLVVLLRRAGIIMDLQDSQYPYIHSYVLSSKDALAKTLIERSGVSAARAMMPLVTLIEDSFLVSVEELKGIARRVGATADYQTWSSPFPQAERWTSFVETAATPIKGEELPEDTVVLMNTGITWSRGIMTLLKPRGRPTDEQTRLTEAYRQMARTVGAQLQDIPQLTIYYRATTPGHPNCGARSIPYVDYTSAETYEHDVIWRLTKGATEQEKQERLKWDWDLFSVHNDVWRRAAARLDSERDAWINDVKTGKIHPGPKKGKAIWRYLEVWNQTLQRPDAHYGPPVDCLNWCSPAIFDQWTMHLNHLLLTDENEKSAAFTDR